MNQLFQQLQSQKISQVKNMINNFRSMNNPQDYINNVLRNNPQINQLVNQYSNPKQAFMNVAKQRGINPNEILNLFK